MLHRHALTAVALAANVVLFSSVAHADDPPKAPPPPKPTVAAPPTDVQPTTPMGVSPPTAEPTPTPPMPNDGWHHHEHDGAPSAWHHEHGEGGNQVSVTVSSDRPHAMLFRSTSTGYVAAGPGALTMTNARTFVPVCAAPCRITTDENATYRIGGEGVAVSDEFRLPTGQGNNVDLKVHGGSAAARKGGGAMIGGGVTALVAGGALLIAGYASRPDYTDAKYVGEPRYLKNDLDTSRHVRIAGFIVAPLGALFVLVGSVLTAVGHTSVETGNTRLASTPPKPMAKLTLDGAGFTF